MLAKSLVTPADTLIFDLEDSIALDQKIKARSKLCEFLKDSTTGATLDPLRVSVRPNGVEDPHFMDDLHAVLAIPSVTTLVIPKVLGPYHLGILERAVGPDRPINIVASIESARAVWGLNDIVQWKPVVNTGVQLKGILFAAEDYCADARVTRTKEGSELLIPRSQIATAARAFGLWGIDMVTVDYQDQEQLALETGSAHRLGFSGKQAIHPHQVQLIQRMFSVTAPEIDYAVKVLNSMQDAIAQGRGAFKLVDRDRVVMIDEPMVKQAKNTLRTARDAGVFTRSFTQLIEKQRAKGVNDAWLYS
ncbi:beta subunit of citrate lyase [Exidia glandulosa HHB12029]|uniref:Beta subunit of citrate lyase n=1 Tax=Exidia glandulosa HHB12029 TaxID=1314781 RepID=A0A165M762_EXIGL|nr:beta subunit of citrate lyase [Exidia glandulosa HHB12029]